jgi:eukaryotic-like serine/threonine-protein kinase
MCRPPEPAMVERSQPAESSQQTAHSRDDEQTVIVGVAPASSRNDPSSVIQGSTLGRFVVLEQIGAGGMGRVLRAYDPKLHREVALKLMRTVDSTATERMLREAQAMAQLSHPNVLPIFDVGEHEGGLFLAMEFVEGNTVRQWCNESRPGWRDVLRVFRDAGEGLAAAHRAGLVHRDFKPDNMLIDAAGRVRVMDFGLARATDEDLVGEPNIDDLGLRSSTGARSDALTEFGTVLGTPAYLAPEQHVGVAGDRRSDQYAYCVALYEALHGQRPFAGETLEALAQAKARMQLRALPSSAPPVPKWIDRVLARGLRSNPDERWPSVEILVAELDRDDARSWRRRALFLVVGLGVVGTTTALVRSRAQLCSGAERQLADVWDARRSSSLEAAFVATGAPGAADAATRARAKLEAYAVRWAESYRETCEATRKRGEQSQEIMDARMRCLQGRHLALSALVDALENADADVVHKAVEASMDLPSVHRCDDIDYVMAQVPPPDDPAIEGRVETLRERLARARALHSAGRYAEGLPVARAIAQEAETLGYAPLLAEALQRLAEIEQGTGAYEAALASFRRSYFEARRSGVDEIAAQSSSALVLLLGAHLRQFDDALAWAEHARADVDRVGTDEMRAHVLNHTAAVYYNQGSYDEAERLYEEALTMLERVLDSETSGIASTLSGLAFIHHTRGSSEKAVAQFERALAILEQLLGPEHPDVAVALSNLGLAHRARRSFDEALRVNESALAIRERVLGPEHPEVAASLANLASVHFAAADHEKALPLYERALAICERSFRPEHPRIGEVLNNLAATHAVLGNDEMAALMHERAFAIWEATFGPDHPMVATSLNNQGNVARARGEHTKAAELYGRALRAWERSLGLEHQNVAYALMGVGETALELGRPDEAIAPLQRAVSIRAAHDTVSTDVAAARFALARALWDAPSASGRDRPRARELAVQARAAYLDAGEAESLVEVDAWLSDTK